MNIWLAISLVFAVLTVYLLVIEIFSVALKLTGMASSKIKFQVASLFTGAGYTTSESELIAKDETRRKIATACMYTGHLFSVAFMGLLTNVVISLSLYQRTEKTPHFTEWYFIVLYVTIGFFLLVAFLKIPPVNRRFQRFLENMAIKFSNKNKKKNIVNVFDLQGKHAISEVILNIVPDYMNETPLSKMGLTKKYAITVLSIRRDSRIIEVSKDTMFKKGDVIVVYGLINNIKEAFVYSVSNEQPKEQDKSNEISLVNNYGDNALVEASLDEVPNQFKGVKIIDAKLKEKYGITVVMVKRDDEYLSVSKDTTFEKGDTLSLFGPFSNIKTLFRNDENNKNSEEKPAKSE